MMESPCIKVCELNSELVCIGCGRTQDEIRDWMILTDEERKEIMEILMVNSISRQPTKLDHLSPTQFRFVINQLPKVEFF